MKFLHMMNVEKNISCWRIFPHKKIGGKSVLSQFTLFCPEICFVAIYTFLSQNLFYRHLSALAWRNLNQTIVSLEKNYIYQVHICIHILWRRCHAYWGQLHSYWGQPGWPSGPHKFCWRRTDYRAKSKRSKKNPKQFWQKLWCISILDAGLFTQRTQQKKSKHAIAILQHSRFTCNSKSLETIFMSSWMSTRARCWYQSPPPPDPLVVSSQSIHGQPRQDHVLSPNHQKEQGVDRRLDKILQHHIWKGFLNLTKLRYWLGWSTTLLMICDDKKYLSLSSMTYWNSSTNEFQSFNKY